MIEAIALAEQLAGRELDVERHGVATGDVRRTRADVAKAERELGWRPTTPLADGLRAQWEWVAARVAARVSEVRRRDGVDLDAEREVDLRSAWTRISERWWLPLGGLVLGAILGVLVAVGSGDVYRAEALIYLGQPFTPAGGGQLQSLQTNPKTVSEIVRSEAAIRVAANAADMRPGALRGNVTSTPVVQPGQVARNFTPLVEIEVRGPTKVKAEKAANSFANTVTQAVVPYITQKMRLLEQQIADDEDQLRDIEARIASANRAQRLAFADAGLSLGEKLLVSANSNLTVNAAESRRAAVNTSRNAARAAPLARQERRALARRAARRRRAHLGHEPAKRRRGRRARRPPARRPRGDRRRPVAAPQEHRHRVEPHGRGQARRGRRPGLRGGAARRGDDPRDPRLRRRHRGRRRSLDRRDGRARAGDGRPSARGDRARGQPGRRGRDRDRVRALPRARDRRDVRHGRRQPDGSRRARRARRPRRPRRGRTTRRRTGS